MQKSTLVPGRTTAYAIPSHTELPSDTLCEHEREHCPDSGKIQTYPR